MTAPTRDRTDAAVRSWLASDVGAGSSDVLETALVRTRTVRQRAGVVARALGTPGGTAPRSIASPAIASVAMAIVAVLAVILGSWAWDGLAGAATRSDGPAGIAVPSPRPDPRASLRPVPSPTTRATIGVGPRPSGGSIPSSRAPAAPRTFAADHFTVTFPASWSVSGGRTAVHLRKMSLFSPTVDIEWVPRGEATRVERGAEASTFELPSGTLDELAAAIERGSGAASSARRDVTVDGIGSVWYATPAASVVGPLAAIAAIPRRDGTVVVTLHLGLEGTPDLAAFRELLVGLQLR